MKILVLNCGSSSLKYQLINMEDESVLAKGNYERIGEQSFLTHKVNGQKIRLDNPVKNHEEAIKFVMAQLTSPKYGAIKNIDEIDAVGHRIVHGGEKFKGSVIVDDQVIEDIMKCSELAPIHNPSAVTGIKACKKLMPNKPMVTVFDTAFHQTIPAKAYMYPLPYAYYEKYKIRKYGFHGTSHYYVSRRIAELLNTPVENLKTIVCHLGQGASICAVKGGKSVDTSMGLTPLGGIPMCARSGDLDPSIVTYLAKKENLSPDKLESMLNKESGLLGLSGVSADLRDIEDAAFEHKNERATLALENYSYRVAQYIAQYSVSMQGIDVIAFTAGIGENQYRTRKMICDNLKFMGAELDDDKNHEFRGEGEISKTGSKIKIYVVPTNEELVIARDTARLISNK